MSKNGKRRVWNPEEKLPIVLAGMEPNVKVSEVCRREWIQPTQYHTWKNQLLGSGRVALSCDLYCVPLLARPAVLYEYLMSTAG